MRPVYPGIQQADRHRVGMFARDNATGCGFDPAPLIFASLVAREKARVVAAEADFGDRIGAGDDTREHRAISVNEDHFALDKLQAIGSDEHFGGRCLGRSEEHTSELQSLMRISYAVFCLKKKKK